jgi:Zn-finger nucleic acid-binding protein
MQCPVDGETLVMADRSGVEIDYCPRCRGVWLDRGELDKIIDRAAGGAAAAAVAPAPARAAAPGPVYQPEPRRAEPRHEDVRRRHDDDDDDHRYYGKKKRRESFLSDLFDF